MFNDLEANELNILYIRKFYRPEIKKHISQRVTVEILNRISRCPIHINWVKWNGTDSIHWYFIGATNGKIGEGEVDDSGGISLGMLGIHRSWEKEHTYCSEASNTLTLPPHYLQ